MKRSWLARISVAAVLALTLPAVSPALAATFMFEVSDSSVLGDFGHYSFVIDEAKLDSTWPAYGDYADNVSFIGVNKANVGIGRVLFSTPEAGFGGGFEVILIDDMGKYTVPSAAIGDYLLKTNAAHTISFPKVLASDPLNPFMLSSLDGTNIQLDITTVAASAAPEPTSWALMIVGVSGLGVGLRRRRVRSRALA